MKCIDMRTRPPYKGQNDSTILRYVRTELHKNDIAKINSFCTVSVPESALKGDMDMYTREIDECEVAVGVVPLRVYHGAPGELYDQAEMFELNDRYPGRFIPAPQIDPFLPEYAEKDFERLILSGKSNVIYMEPGQRAMPVPVALNDERLFPLYEKCLKNDIRIIIQIGSCRNTLRYNQCEMMQDVLEKFRGLKVCASHGAWPMALDYIRLAQAFPNFVISPDWYFGIVPGCEFFHDAANGWLQDQILFGSSYPLCSTKDAVAMYEKFVKPEILPKIMYHNAARFLGLE